jgi:hypothetical protein
MFRSQAIFGQNRRDAGFPGHVTGQLPMGSATAKYVSAAVQIEQDLVGARTLRAQPVHIDAGQLPRLRADPFRDNKEDFGEGLEMLPCALNRDVRNIELLHVAAGYPAD